MRAIFLVLLLANAAFYAYAFVARERGAAHAPGRELQVNADAIRVVRRSATGVGPGAGARPAAPAACLEWGVLAGPDVARAEAALASLALPSARIQRTSAEVGGYWVYIPPLGSAPAVEKKLKELKALGVHDHQVVQDVPQWRNAIALGTFQSDEAAASFLGALKAKGVRTAVIGRRDNLITQVTYFVREPGLETVARFAELQREFSGSQIRAAPCPAAPEGARG